MSDERVGLVSVNGAVEYGRRGETTPAAFSPGEARMGEVPERYNVSTLLDANLEKGRGEKVAIYHAEERITYGELFNQMSRMGRALRELGVDRENRVLLILDDTLAFPIALFGALRIGAVPVPANPLYRVADLRYFLEDSEARVIIVDNQYLEKLTQALEGYDRPATIVVTGDAASGTLRLADLLSTHAGDLPPARTHRDDMAFWLYSSGSTGNPKAVVHLHHDVPYVCATIPRHVLGITPNDIVLSRVLFHAYGLGNSLWFPFSVGASSVLRAGRPTPPAILETIQRYHPSLFFSVPTFYNAILNHPQARQYDLSSIRLCVSAGEPLPPETWRRWRDTFGLTILDAVGSTELLHMYCANTPTSLRPGSNGRPVPGYELKIVDEAGPPVAPDQEGELYVKGDSMAPYYWRQHAKSVHSMRGEWFKTGDRYRVDADGYYWYAGRVDDLFKVRGEWISPIEMENILIEHPAVSEAAVVGAPGADGLNVVHAWIVVRDAVHASDALVSELQEWCKGQLQRYQYPQQVHFVAELPKTLTGKIQRFKLREAVAEAGATR